MSKSISLTPKQERFRQEYIKDLNATQAAIRAGYSQKTAREQAARMLSKVSIQEHVTELVQKVADKNELSAEWVLNNLKEVVERCMQKVPVIKTIDGERMQAINEEGRAIWKFDSAGANSALEKLGKYFKLFTDRVETEQKGTIHLIQLSDLRSN